MFACLDIETNCWNRNNLELRIIFGYICYYSGENKVRKTLFHSAKEVFDDIEKVVRKTNTPLLIFAHNSDYDTKFLLNYAISHYELKVIDNGSMYSCKIYKIEKGKRKKLCEFRNSLRLFPMSIKEMGKFCRLRKLERPFTEENDDFHRYCIRDCDIIYKSLRYLVRFFNTLDFPMEVEKLPMSFPSIAYKLFHKMNSEFDVVDEKSRHKNMLTNIADWINDYFRKFYYGGRCEVFDMNIYEEVAYLDFNSLYTFIMTSNKFPKPKYWRVIDYSYTKRTFAVLCVIDESNELFPIIPQKIDGKLLFTASIKTSLITIEEYLYIVENRPNTRIEIKERWECDYWINPFYYMIPLNEKRQIFKKEGNPYQLGVKQVLNSTYGKFAEGNEKMETSFYKISELTSDKVKILLSKAHFFKWFDDYLVVYSRSSVSHLSLNVVFAHRITSLARLELVKKIDCFTKIGITCIYCDTDSIVVDTRNLELLKPYLDEYILGKMKIERIYTKFCALAPKEYLFLEKNSSRQMQKAKGISDCSLIDYYSVNGVEMVRPAKYHECIQRNIDFQSALIIKKRKQTFYDKRIINDDFTTNPISSIDELTKLDNKSQVLRQIDNYKSR